MMLAWLTTLSLRMKAYALGAAVLLATFALFWFRWKAADARADKAEQQAEALTATRKVEKAIRDSRTKLTQRQAKVREEISKQTGRDYFEDGGWGP